MEQPLSVLVVLVLVSTCSGGEAPNFCHQKICPQYQVVGSHQGFEERLYVSTDWISTKIGSPESSDLMAALSRLKDYCHRQKTTGSEIPTNTWPVLITLSESEDGPDFSMSWFLPPGTTKPENPDPSFTFQTRPQATVYVRVFGGTPTIRSGQENAKILREALNKAGKSFDPHTYSGAEYGSYLALTHRNEIWMYAA